MFQVLPSLFNRASLMNVGFVEASSRGHYDCYFFHDVDVLPLDDRNMYTCSDRPRHFAGYLQKWNYTCVSLELSALSLSRLLQAIVERFAAYMHGTLVQQADVSIPSSMVYLDLSRLARVNYCDDLQQCYCSSHAC